MTREDAHKIVMRRFDNRFSPLDYPSAKLDDNELWKFYGQILRTADSDAPAVFLDVYLNPPDLTNEESDVQEQYIDEVGWWLDNWASFSNERFNALNDAMNEHIVRDIKNWIPIIELVGEMQRPQGKVWLEAIQYEAKKKAIELTQKVKDDMEAAYDAIQNRENYAYQAELGKSSGELIYPVHSQEVPDTLSDILT